MKYINIGLLLAMLIGIFQPVIAFADEWNSDMPESSTDVPVLIDGKINDELSENDQMTATLSTSIASGTFGTSDWYIDLDGILHIEEGEFADTPKVNGYSQSPWLNYSDTINKVIFEGPVKASSSLNNLFDYLSKVTEIQNISYLDVSNTTSMQRVFGGCSSLTTLDLTSWDTSNVEDIFSLFNGCVNMEKLDVSTWDARQMKAITYAFSSMEKLKELDLSKWQVTPNLFAQGVFMGDSSLAYLDLSGFNMTNLDSWNSYATSRFFQNTNSLKEIVLSSSFKFRNSSNGPELPNIVANDNYTGKWQNVGEGTVGFPQGADIWTSAEFMNNFDHVSKSDTYVWQPVAKAAGDITVKYVDQAGTEIHEAQKIGGNVGERYDASTAAYQLTIEGYTLDESKLPENSTGILTEQEQTVIYTYTENPKIAGDVTVKYVDQAGTEIHKEQKISGNVGEGYDASTTAYQLTIEGYTLDESKLPENSTGILTEQEQTVTYTYTENPKVAGDVTVKYLDQGGREIHEAQKISGNVGEGYDASTTAYQLTIEGYTLDKTKLPENSTGIFMKQSQTILYVYTINRKIPDSLIDTANMFPPTLSTSKDQRLRKLPKTGEEVRLFSVVAGGALVLLSGLVYLKQRKKMNR